MTEQTDNLVLEHLKAIRKDLADQRTLLFQSVDYMRKMEQRLDARIVATRDDLELMLKSELMGRLTHFETTIEQRLEAIEARFAAGQV
jgi:hypothetical protein